jgi:hypothetical protein
MPLFLNLVRRQFHSNSCGDRQQHPVAMPNPEKFFSANSRLGSHFIRRYATTGLRPRPPLGRERIRLADRECGRLEMNANRSFAQ